MAHLMTFSSKSGSPSLSPSGPYGVGDVSEDTSVSSNPCSRNAVNVAEEVAKDNGSESMDACEFGCTGALGGGEDAEECRVTPVFVLCVEVAEVDAEGGGGGETTVGIRRLFSRNAVFRRTEMSESVAHVRLAQLTRSMITTTF